MNITEPKTHTILIQGDGGRKLLALDVRNGKLVAEYDAADLDEAARIFVRELLGITNQVEP